MGKLAYVPRIITAAALLTFAVTSSNPGDAAQGPKAPPAEIELLTAILEQLQASVEPRTEDDTITLQATSQPTGDRCPSAANRYLFSRWVRPNGFVLPPNFEIPPGQVLVVTNFDWVVSSGANPYRPNSVRTANLLRVRNGGVNGPSAQSSALSDAQGRAGAYETFPTGIVVSSGTDVCIQMNNPGDPENRPEDISATLQGFLFSGSQNDG